MHDTRTTLDSSVARAREPVPGLGPAPRPGVLEALRPAGNSATARTLARVRHGASATASRRNPRPFYPDDEEENDEEENDTDETDAAATGLLPVSGSDSGSI